MISGDAVMLVVSLVVATVAWRAGTPLALLVGAALIMGAVDAFYLPSAGSMPRRLVAEPDLPRALAMRQSGSQVITIAGGPLGGALVATAGFAVAGWIDAGTFAVVLIVLVAIRSRFPLPAPAPR
jgi:MFS family permease